MEKLKEIFNHLDPIAKFPKIRGQNENIHFCRNGTVAGGTAVFVFFIPIQQGT
jgi:hypothetical protein